MTKNINRIASALLILFLVVVLLPGLQFGVVGRARQSAINVRAANFQRQWIVGVHNYLAVNNELPSTLYLLVPFAFDRGLSDSDVISPGSKNTSFGAYTVQEILDGRVTAEQLRNTADELETRTQAWEHVFGYWHSREVPAYTKAHKEVVVSLARIDESHSLIVSFSDGSVRWFVLDDDGISSIIERNRAARERINLAPMPPEFESFLLTGEPASVGDGTFVPPRIEPARN